MSDLKDMNLDEVKVVSDNTLDIFAEDDDENSAARWYVIHTYSGHENKVKANIEKIVESKGMGDVILRIEVPTQTVIETKDGKKKEKRRIIFPGYAFVKMVMNDQSWFLVRNTRGVTGFVGAGTKPTPLTRYELENMGLVKRTVETDYEVGDTVMVVSGYLQNTYGEVLEIFPDRQCVKVLLPMLGGPVPTELDFDVVTRIKK